MAVKYQHILSLGKSCSIAIGLSRLGLREHSGPFDWIGSELAVNIEMIKTGFADFLNPDNLVHRYHPLNNGQYFDKKYNFAYFHDFDPHQDAAPLCEQIDKVKAKYQRRIDYFMNALREGALVIYLTDEYEAPYAIKHLQEIKDYLKTFHPNNDIMFWSQSMEHPENFPELAIHKFGAYSDDMTTGRFVFDDPKLVAFLTDPEIYPAEKRAKNLDFFLAKQLRANTDTDLSEMRIAKERSEYEVKALYQWVRALSDGKRLTDRLVKDGVRSVAFVGVSEMIDVLVPELAKVGIAAKYISVWYSELTEYCGIPVRMANRADPTEEEKEELQRKAEKRKQNGEPEEHPYVYLLRYTQGEEMPDAFIAAEIEMNFFIEKMAAAVQSNAYTIPGLVGMAPLFKE